MSDVTLQISLSPGDWRHAQHILPHQLQVWTGQVGDVLLTLDLHQSQGRFAQGWEEGRDRVEQLIQDCVSTFRDVRTKPVNYSENARSSVGQRYFGHRDIPAKDYRGGPFYTYFFGLFASDARWVLHLDSDMMFGGGSQHWVDEAVTLLQTHESVLACSPLPGPPTKDGSLRTQDAPAFSGQSLAFRFSTLSTRLFLVDTHRLRDRLCPLPLHRPSTRDVVKSTVEGNPPYDLPENVLSDAMKEHGLSRVNFLGSAPGMWSLHPPYRNEEFYRRLPELLRRIRSGDVPDAQRGDYDLNDSMVDWSNERAALQRNRWWKRWGRSAYQWCAKKLIG
jgi:hypothetical protein